jgi:hypothetical protein
MFTIALLIVVLMVRSSEFHAYSVKLVLTSTFVGNCKLYIQTVIGLMSYCVIDLSFTLIMLCLY